MTDAASEIVDLLLSDLRARRGLRHEWDQIDSSVQDEIRSEWHALVRDVIEDVRAGNR